MSISGDAAITISFYRDGSGTTIGKSSLRTSFHTIWPDGSTFRKDYPAENSDFEASLGRSIAGTWEKNGEITSFEIGQDLMGAVITFKTAGLEGSCSFSSLGKPFEPNNDEEEDAQEKLNYLLAPTIHWLQPVPISGSRVEFTVEDRDPIASLVQADTSDFGRHFLGASSWMNCIIFAHLRDPAQLFYYELFHAKMLVSLTVPFSSSKQRTRFSLQRTRRSVPGTITSLSN